MRKTKRKTRIVPKIIAGLILVIMALLLGAAVVPISSPGITDFINKKVSQESNAEFEVQGATLYLLRQINLNKLKFVQKEICLQADIVTIDYNLFGYLKGKKIPGHLRMQNVKLRYISSDNVLALGTIFQLWRRTPGQWVEFNTVEMDLGYSPAGVELGHLEARGEQINVTGRGHYGPLVPVNYQIEVTLPPSLVDMVGGWLKEILVSGKDKEKKMVILELEGDYQNPRCFLKTKAGRMPIR